MQDRSAFKVGLASFLMTLMIAALMVWKSGIFLRASGYELIGEFQDVNGLLKSAEVRYRGYKVGKVSKIIPGPKSIRVHFWLKSHIRIPRGSSLVVVFDGLIGEKYLGVRPNTKEPVMLTAGAVLTGYATSGLATFVDVGTKNLEHGEAILKTLRDIFTSKDVEQSIRAAFVSIEKISANLTQLTAEMNTFTQDGGINDIVQNLRRVSETLDKAANTIFVQGGLDKSIQDISTNLYTMSENLKGVTDKLNTEVLNEETLSDVKVVMSNLADITRKIQGVVGGKDEDDRPQGGTMGAIQTISQLKVVPSTTLYHHWPVKKASFDANVDFNVGNKFIRASVGDRLGTTQLINFQHGIRFGNSITTRFGLFNTKPGFGFDYQFLSDLGFSVDIFNINSLEVDVSTRYAFMEHMDILLNLRKDPLTTNEYTYYGIGMSYYFR